MAFSVGNESNPLLVLEERDEPHFTRHTASSRPREAPHHTEGFGGGEVGAKARSHGCSIRGRARTASSRVSAAPAASWMCSWSVFLKAVTRLT